MQAILNVFVSNCHFQLTCLNRDLMKGNVLHLVMSLTPAIIQSRNLRKKKKHNQLKKYINQVTYFAHSNVSESTHFDPITTKRSINNHGESHLNGR